MAEQNIAPQPLYGVTIHQAIASGDLARMKEVLRQAEQHLAEYGDVQTAVELLKLEIARSRGQS